ncbi:MAG: DUF1566 domain-containing protein [Candidatus Nitrohelix vancouverensis]|uniref:DUF1566 domain-containing protein n=1 Tax=Candidatus Nitrohelix vancouverensis TaxID=2705534 RepID=A0A7T0C1X9_9BACT|nr:MAG: DUF1566 domain-containing protein [Candidatus Nitrohelix vancouverensis]
MSEEIENEDTTEEIVDDAAELEEGEEEFLEEEFIGGDEWGEEEEDEEGSALAEEEIPNYIDNGDGTIGDTRNKLIWKKDDSYREFGYGITWYEAHDYCEKINEDKFAGYDDWRLCGPDEAKSLFSFTKSNYDKDGAEIHIDPSFAEDGGHNTWTYDEKPEYPQYAMKFSYVTGNTVWENKDNEYSHCRLVRDVVSDEWEPEWRSETRKFER